MRSNIQLKGIVARNINHVYRNHDTGFDEWLPETRLIDLEKYHVPESGTPINATIFAYEQRIVLKKVGRAPACAGVIIRGLVNMEFSRKSRRRLMNAFHSWQVPEGYKRYHIVLTYPSVYSDDWTQWKLHLKAFKRKMTAIFGEKLIGYWRLELQKRGAPHYHLFVALPKGIITNKRLKKTVTEEWRKIAHKDDQYQGKYATQVKVIHDDAMASRYISKYVSKVESEPEFVAHDPCGNLGDDPSLSEEFDREVQAYLGRKHKASTIGRHWGRIGAPNEKPIAQATIGEMQISLLRKVACSWLAKFNPEYANKLQAKPDYLSWQVYGIKGNALLMIWEQLFLPLSCNDPPDGFIPLID